LTDDEIWSINISTELYKKFLGTPRDSLESPGGFNFTEEGKTNSKLFIGNLPFGGSDEDLKKLFSEAGAVQSAKIVTDPYSGRPRGFGFVEMPLKADAEKAILLFNSKTLTDRALTVNEADLLRKEAVSPEEEETETDRPIYER